jgi:UDPglucose--hexose-1-phosphate uridylyltransferase
MSEFRQDPFTGRWRIIAEGRSSRPNEYTPAPLPRGADPECPFCEGNERRTPPESAAVRTDRSPENGPGWAARAIPNRFPTVAETNGPPPAQDSAVFRRVPGRGHHEVVIESPTHSPDLPYLSASQLRLLFRFFRDRVRALSARPSISAVVLFENRGAESGGTLAHPHAQIVATEQIPSRLEEEMRAFGRGGPSESERCVLESILLAELKGGQRIIAQDAAFVTLAPFASEHPYETWFVPRRHVGSFADASDEEVDLLAESLPCMLRALDRIRPNASYNWYVHGLSTPLVPTAGFHWHVELAPRLLRADGYELGAGIPVNPVTPETAAADLRSQLESEAKLGARKR